MKIIISRKVLNHKKEVEIWLLTEYKNGKSTRLFRLEQITKKRTNNQFIMITSWVDRKNYYKIRPLGFGLGDNNKNCVIAPTFVSAIALAKKEYRRLWGS